MKVRLGDYVKIRTGKLDANAAAENGAYPFFTCAVEPLRIDTFSYNCECVLVAGNGDLNVKYYNGKFDAYQRTYIIEKRKQQLEKLDLLVKSKFIEIFDEPILNPYKWEMTTNGDIVTEVRYRTSRPAVEGGKYPYLKMNNLTFDGYLDLSELKYIDIPEN